MTTQHGVSSISHSLLCPFLLLPVWELILILLICHWATLKSLYLWPALFLFSLVHLVCVSFMFFLSSTRTKFTVFSCHVFSWVCVNMYVCACMSVCVCMFVYARTCTSLHLCLWVFLWCHWLMHSMTYWGNKKLLCRDGCGPLIKHLLCDLIAGSCHRISYIFWALRQNASPIPGAKERGKRGRNGH